MIFTPKTLKLIYEFKTTENILPSAELLGHLLHNKSIINIKTLYKLLYSHKEINYIFAPGDFENAGISLNKIQKNTIKLQEYEDILKTNKNIKIATVDDKQLFINTEEIYKIYSIKLETLIKENFMKKKIMLNSQELYIAVYKDNIDINNSIGEFGSKTKNNIINDLEETEEDTMIEMEKEETFINLEAILNTEMSIKKTNIKIPKKEKKVKEEKKEIKTENDVEEPKAPKVKKEKKKSKTIDVDASVKKQCVKTLSDFNLQVVNKEQNVKIDENIKLPKLCKAVDFSNCVFAYDGKNANKSTLRKTNTQIIQVETDKAKLSPLGSIVVKYKICINKHKSPETNGPAYSYERNNYVLDYEEETDVEDVDTSGTSTFVEDSKQNEEIAHELIDFENDNNADTFYKNNKVPVFLDEVVPIRYFK